ncbi:MAG: serine/threonine protein kinase [Deltaproteobacteria bacterium]|nr:serine/threonine protein kinase [Deltaproteobacteria bacterium]
MRMGDEHFMSLQPGTVIAGRYEVIKCLGAGNMGLVYACRHRELAGHMVAVKVLFPEVAQDKIAAQRFRNEIFAAYGVSHPNVVRAYEYLRDGDLVAYTMEYVGGGDLATRLESNQLMPINEAVNILCQICSGVQAIHDAGIVHRDLKPENILLTTEGMVKIGDFGIARVGHSSKLTEHGGVVGTINYVAPEYMLNSQVDWRSDIYAIGILGYEMLTGKSPFRGDSVYATMTMRLKSDAAPPSTLRPEIPPGLDAVIKRALERDPLQRYQAAADMFCDLHELLPDRGIISKGMMLHISQHQSGAFVGPKCTHENEAVEDEEAATLYEDEVEDQDSVTGTDEMLPEERLFGKARPAATPVYADGEATVALSGFGAHGTVMAASPFSAAFASRAEPEDDLDVVETVDIVSQYRGERKGHAPPPRMESALNYEEIVCQEPQTPNTSTQVIINSAGIDESRVRRLSQSMGRAESSLWIEVLTLITAIIIGVGVGFFFIKLFFPELVGGAPSVSAVSTEQVAGVGGDQRTNVQQNGAN